MTKENIAKVRMINRLSLSLELLIISFSELAHCSIMFATHVPCKIYPEILRNNLYEISNEKDLQQYNIASSSYKPEHYQVAVLLTHSEVG